MRRILLIVAVTLALACASPRTPAPVTAAGVPMKNLAERLGYPRDARLLIIHGDDLGMAHSVNEASIEAMENGAVNSASIMVPCPWFPEIAEYARKHPNADLGLHLTLTSEWTHYKWGPVLPEDEVPSLIDENGYLYATEDLAAANIEPREAEAEIRAQIDRAREFGIQPTHLDSHMRTLHVTPELFAVLLRVSREYRIPAAIPREFTRDPDLGPLLGPDDIVIDRFITIGPEVPAEQWARFYEDTILSLEPGVTELIIHLAYDDAEMQAATSDHPNWGAAWRQRDFDFFTGDEVRRLLRENNVQVITWRELGRLLR